MINLTTSEVNRATYIVRDVFKKECDKDVIAITDIIQNRLCNAFGEELREEDNFYRVMDRYMALSECYTILAFNLELYRKGKTRKEWFYRICDSFAQPKGGES